jgi:preprotein translocase subunit SecG
LEVDVVETLLTVLHVTVCLFMIGIVLLQKGKGAEMGAAFGGSSQTLFGSRGAATFLNKLTTAAAALFMITSLLLAMSLTKGGSSVVKDVPAEQTTAAPQQPAEQKPATK